MEINNIFENANLKDGFAGDRRYLKGFLAKMDLIFLINHDRFDSDELKVAFVISRLFGEAMNWAATLIENQDPCLYHYENFVYKLKSSFGCIDYAYIANQKLRTVRQRTLGGINGYILEFNKYADESTWNEEAKMDAFVAGLQDQVATRILELFPGPETLSELQTIASRIDSRIACNRKLFSKNPNKSTKSTRNQNTHTTFHGPLSKEEKERRRRENLCAYCGDANHKLNDCPKRRRNPKNNSQISAHVTNSEFKRRIRVSDNINAYQTIIDFNVKTPESTVKTKILLDSGSEFNLMDEFYARQYHIPYSTKDNLPDISGIGGAQPVIGMTEPITLIYKDHRCKVEFYVVDLPAYCCLLGAEWLSVHNPSINFRSKELSFNSDYCNSYCKNASPSHPVHSVARTPSNNTRVEKIINSLPSQLLEFQDVFNESNAHRLPPHRPYDCEIILKPNAQLYFGPQYFLTSEEERALEKYIIENLKWGYIQKSKSPAGASIFFVRKKTGELRLVVDYRRLNEDTVRYSHPLPLILDIIERLGAAKIFSKLDLRSAYNLVRIKEGDEYKTAFTCKFGHFEYLVMPFGLKNAPAVFQHFINDVLEGIQGEFVYSYIDDIIIFSPDEETHLKHLREVLSRLRKAGLYAKLEKCLFFVTTIDFLGYRISTSGIGMDPNKVSAITEWPVPSNTKDVQSFIGFANYYRRFIPNFAKIAHPLHCLLKKNTPFRWSKDAQSAFDFLKSAFTSAPILSFPDRSLQFLVETDASNFAIGAVLSQVSPTDSKVHPVAYYSRSLTPPERNYAIYDKELLAIVSSLENWRHFLKGSSIPFKIYSDHRNLLFQKKPQRMTERLVRWSLFLSEFNFTIEYRPGSANGKPDRLSRRPDYIVDDSDSSNSFSVLRPENFCALTTSISSINDQILSAYKSDELYHKICNFLNDNSLPAPHPKIDKFSLSNSFLLFSNRIYIPSPCRSAVLHICHDSPAAGHFGIRKTINLAKRDFWWPSLYVDVKDYVRACPTCCRSKEIRHKPYGYLQPLPISDRPWSSISMDFVTDLPSSDKCTCILVVIDRLTKMGHFIPLPSVPSSVETADVFINSIFRLHGLPDEIITDRGTQFTSKFWNAVCSSLNVSLSLSSPFHHQSNGQTERVNSVIEQYLRCFTNYKGTDWKKFISLAEFSYNNALQDSAKNSPFFLNYGFNPRHSPAIPSASEVPRATIYTKELVQLTNELKKNLSKASSIQKKYADQQRCDQPPLKPGDLVYVDFKLFNKKRNKKLDPRRIGPFEVLEQISPVSYKIKLPDTVKIHPVIHISDLEPLVEDKFERKEQPLPPIIINNEEHYEVEEILDKRTHYGKTQYLVKWKGYPLTEASWEPENNLNCPEILETFNNSNKK